VGYYAIEGGDTGRKLEQAAYFGVVEARTAEKTVCPGVDRGGRRREAIILAVYSPAFS